MISQIHYGYSTKADGNMALHVGDDETTVVTNRRRFLDKLGLDMHNLICLNQTHSNNIVVASKELAGAGAFSHFNAISDSDAVVTNEENLILSIMTADCVPIIIYDEALGVIGAVHAGWRGTAGEIVKKTAQLMLEYFGCEAKNIKAKIFPGIGECCYEVGDETAQLCGCTGEKYLDLQSINYNQLLSVGIIDKNIYTNKTCTACGDKNLFSYRAEGGKSGRFMSFVVKSPAKN